MDMHAGVPTGSSPLIEGDGYGAYYGEKPGNIGYNWNAYVDTVSYGKANSPGLNDVSHSACWVYLDGSVGSSVWGVTDSYGTLRSSTTDTTTTVHVLWIQMVTSATFGMSSIPMG